MNTQTHERVERSARISMRPRVICHMATSIDGRIVADGWPDSLAVRREYEAIHAAYEADAWMCGRITMEPFAGAVRSDVDVKREYIGPPREDHIAPDTHDSFAVAIDPSGRLAWDKNGIDGDHVIAVLSERVSNEYLAFLRDRGVSYLIAGKRDIDLAVALEKLGAHLGIRTVMLEGGGHINGGMLAAGLIDEVSLLVSPVADGRIGTPALFDVDADEVTPRRLLLEAAERRADNFLWLRYRVEGSGYYESLNPRAVFSDNERPSVRRCTGTSKSSLVPGVSMVGHVPGFFVGVGGQSSSRSANPPLSAPCRTTELVRPDQRRAEGVVNGKRECERVQVQAGASTPGTCIERRSRGHSQILELWRVA